MELPRRDQDKSDYSSKILVTDIPQTIGCDKMYLIRCLNFFSRHTLPWIALCPSIPLSQWSQLFVTSKVYASSVLTPYGAGAAVQSQSQGQVIYRSMTQSHLSPCQSTSIITHKLPTLSPTHGHTLFQVLDILSTSLITVSLWTLTTLSPLSALYCLASPIWTTSLYCIAVGSLWPTDCIIVRSKPSYSILYFIQTILEPISLSWSVLIYITTTTTSLTLFTLELTWQPFTIVPVSLIPINPPGSVPMAPVIHTSSGNWPHWTIVPFRWLLVHNWT